MGPIIVYVCHKHQKCKCLICQSGIDALQAEYDAIIKERIENIQISRLPMMYITQAYPSR